MSKTMFASKRLHAALFTAATAIFVAVPTAQAAIVFVQPPAPIAIGNNIDGVYLNVITGATGTSGAALAGWDIDVYNNGGGLTFFGTGTPYGVLATGTPGTTAEATALSFGAMISPAGQYNQFQTRGAAFQSAGTRYLGFRFLNETTGATNYGWLQISSGGLPAPDGGFPASILSYGYENMGGSITAGAMPAPVPEPSTWAMFSVALLGGLGLRRLRQGRAA
jgi:hypothetical protein